MAAHGIGDVEVGRRDLLTVARGLLHGLHVPDAEDAAAELHEAELPLPARVAAVEAFAVGAELLALGEVALHVDLLGVRLLQAERLAQVGRLERHGRRHGADGARGGGARRGRGAPADGARRGRVQAAVVSPSSSSCGAAVGVFERLEGGKGTERLGAAVDISGGGDAAVAVVGRVGGHAC